jgi:hypothetical protein
MKLPAFCGTEELTTDRALSQMNPVHNFAHNFINMAGEEWGAA